jgi:hypothetical protein
MLVALGLDSYRQRRDRGGRDSVRPGSKVGHTIRLIP